MSYVYILPGVCVLYYPIIGAYVFAVIVDMFDTERSILRRTPLIKNRAIGIIGGCTILFILALRYAITHDMVPPSIPTLALLNIVCAVSMVAIYASVGNYYWSVKYVLPLGGSLNMCAVFANQWQMPVDPEAARRIFAYNDIADTFHSVMTSNTRFKFLCDRFDHPLIFDGISSVGDYMLLLSITLMTGQLLIPHLARKRPL